MTPSTFELLSQLLSPSEHIPKGNAFGRRPIEARKQIAVAVRPHKDGMKREVSFQISLFDIGLKPVNKRTDRKI